MSTSENVYTLLVLPAAAVAYTVVVGENTKVDPLLVEVNSVVLSILILVPTMSVVGMVNEMFAIADLLDLGVYPIFFARETTDDRICAVSIKFSLTAILRYTAL